MINFENAQFQTEYSFSSARAIIRPLSDAFSKQNCDTKGAVKYAVKKTKGKCIYCGHNMYELSEDNIPKFKNDIHYDHIYPASKMNLFEVGNVAIACTACNLEKSDRLPMDYYDLRTERDADLYIGDRYAFEVFLEEYTKPYCEKWPLHYAAGLKNYEENTAEFKLALMQLLVIPVDISPMTSKYNHESSINKTVWEKVVEKAKETYQPMTAKDVEGRVGFTNELFEEMFGAKTKIENISIVQLGQFSHKLLLNKKGSKNEVQKYRMLLKMLIEVLNDEYMQGQLDEFYKKVPTYKEIVDMENE